MSAAPLEGLSLRFSGERLTAIEAEFPHARFGQVLGGLIRELGPGQAELGSMRRNPGGSAGNVIYVWRQGSQLLRVEQVSRDAARSSLIITQKNFLSELLAR